DVSRGPQDDEQEAGPALLGDVVLCPEVAAKQAVEAGHPAEAELHMLATHGVLHLLGYDHAEPEEAQEMFGLQGELLAAWSGQSSGSGSESL
ncbi:MAG: putative rRNA maturation factor, partial [Frankiales bacterium]|nr:putative rRNA maturation factor [Frankiales bacterium]